MEDDLALERYHLDSIRMLQEVLDGATLAAISARTGVSRSAVDRRVKAMALHLTQEVGVKGLQEDAAGFVSRLRGSRAAILQALERLDLLSLCAGRSSRVIPAKEVELGAARLRSRSSRVNHDLALYHLPFATGLRPLEAARLDVMDYLTQDGKVRRESRVRAEVATNGKDRPLYFIHRRLDETLDAYLDERRHVGHGLGRNGEWRGLDPHSRLFLDEQGQAYAVTPNGTAREGSCVCRPMLENYRKIFRQADVAGLSTRSARVTLMSLMYARGADEDQVGLVLGISDRSAVRRLMARPRQQLARVLDQLV